MSNNPEIGAIKAIDEALNAIPDQKTRDRVLNWAWDKYSTKGTILQTDQKPKLTVKKQVLSSKKPKKSKKVKLSYSIIKDLNLKPSGKKSFKAFIEEKKPESHPEKCSVSVYYLSKDIGIKEITPQHIYTCYKDVGWRVPTNLRNRLAVTASRHGWIDTSDMNNIMISTRGENLVEQDLPRNTNGK